MTLKYERTNAVIHTEQFLIELCDPKQTSRIPKEIREQARRLLRHYPTKTEMTWEHQDYNNLFGPDTFKE